MSGEIIQNGDSPRDEDLVSSVAITENKTVPVQLVQQIYKEITGKTERLGKSYDQNILLELDDVLNMNHAFEHALEQYNVEARNCLISVFHTDDTHDRHSSFERFAMHSRGSSSSIETIHIKYNFMIVLPKTHKMQTFTVSIRFLSRVAVEKRLGGDYFAAPPKAVAFMGRRTAFVEVEYVDYMVAKNLLRVFDEWYGTVKKTKANKIMRFMQNKSDSIPDLLAFFAALISFVTIIDIMPKYINPASANFLIFGQFVAICIFMVFVAISFSKLLGEVVENSIDRWSVISYIKITKGDEAAISEANRLNKKSVIAAIIGTLFSFSISVLGKIVAHVLASDIIKP